LACNNESFRDVEGWPATVLVFAGNQINNIIQDLDYLNCKIQIHEQNSYPSLQQLCEERIGLSIHPSDSSCLYLAAPFYVKLENLRLSQNSILTGLFKCHNFFDLSEFRLKLNFYPSSGGQISSNMKIQYCKTADKTFKEFELNEKKENTFVSELFFQHSRASVCLASEGGSITLV
jgi:hypothetical protein